jgi:hypothetical protein
MNSSGISNKNIHNKSEKKSSSVRSTGHSVATKNFNNNDNNNNNNDNDNDNASIQQTLLEKKNQSNFKQLTAIRKKSIATSL